MSNFNQNSGAPWGRPDSRAIGGARAVRIDLGLRAYMIGVYNHMMLGLGVTALVAMGVSMLATTTTAAGKMALTPLGQALYLSPLKWFVIFAPVGLSLFLSARINRLSASSARAMFLLFAASVGLSTSVLIAIYTGASITRAFFITSASFGCLSLYGYTTKRDLSGIGSFLCMGAFGLLIASCVNLFLPTGQLGWILSVLSVVIFSGLTAYDTQAIKESYYAQDSFETSTVKSVYGALMLYINFINVFQSLVYLTGDRND